MVLYLRIGIIFLAFSLRLGVRYGLGLFFLRLLLIPDFLGDTTQAGSRHSPLNTSVAGPVIST